MPARGQRRGERTRLLEHVQRSLSGCLEWTGQTNRGYGVFKRDGGRRRDKAHRVSYELHTGAPIPTGLFVCHRCDNPKCVEPTHLFLGTAAVNNTDAATKGRSSNQWRKNPFRPRRTLSMGGRTQTIAQWAAELGIPKHRIYGRLRIGWSDTEALHGRHPQPKFALQEDVTRFASPGLISLDAPSRWWRGTKNQRQSVHLAPPFPV